MNNTEPKSFLTNNKPISEEGIKKNKNTYIESFTDEIRDYNNDENNEIGIEIVKKHFEIIEAFANRKKFFYNDNSEKNLILKRTGKQNEQTIKNREEHVKEVNSKISDRLRIDEALEIKDIKSIRKTKIIPPQTKLTKTEDSEKNYFVTDIHGDLFSLLQVLTGNEDNTKNPAQFKKGEPCVIYRDVTKNPPETYNDISEIENINLKNLVPIPNLEPNPDFQGNFIFGGDIIDRGKETESCFYALENLINENQLLGKKKKNIIYEIGNHEEFVMLNNFKYSILNGFQCLFYDIKHDCEYKDMIFENNHSIFQNKIECMEKAMRNMVKNNTMQLMHTDNNNIYCHAVVNKKSILKALNGIKENFSDKILKSYFDEEKIKIKQIKELQKKIEKNKKKLTTDDVKLLVNSLNTLTKYHFNLENKNEKINELFLNNIPNPDFYATVHTKGISEDIPENIPENINAGLLWDREIKNDQNKPTPIKGMGLFVVGHDIQNSGQININGQHLFADVGTSIGYDDYYTTTAAQILEIDKDSRVIQHFQQFDRRELRNRYEALKDSLNLTTPKDIKQITEGKSEEITHSPSKNTPDLDILQEESEFKEQFKAADNIVDKITIFTDFVHQNEDKISENLDYAKK